MISRGGMACSFEPICSRNFWALHKSAFDKILADDKLIIIFSILKKEVSSSLLLVFHIFIIYYRFIKEVNPLTFILFSVVRKIYVLIITFSISIKATEMNIMEYIEFGMNLFFCNDGLSIFCFYIEIHTIN